MRLFFALLLALFVVSARAATPVYFSLQDFTVTPLAVTQMKLTAISAPGMSGQIIIRSNQFTWTSTNGTITTNIAAGNYRVDVIGNFNTASFSILVPTSSDTVDAREVITIIISQPGTVSSWTTTAADRRYPSIPGGALTATTNSDGRITWDVIGGSTTNAIGGVKTNGSYVLSAATTNLNFQATTSLTVTGGVSGATVTIGIPTSTSATVSNIGTLTANSPLIGQGGGGITVTNASAFRGLIGAQAELGFTPMTNSYAAVTNALGFVVATNGESGGGTVSNAAAFTLNAPVIGQGNGALATTNASAFLGLIGAQAELGYTPPTNSIHGITNSLGFQPMTNSIHGVTNALGYVPETDIPGTILTNGDSRAVLLKTSLSISNEAEGVFTFALSGGLNLAGPDSDNYVFADGDITAENGFYAQGAHGFNGAHIGDAQGLTNGHPNIATNGATATDGWFLSKTGGKVKWVAAAGTGNAFVEDGLDQFAATSSSELAGVISDETGTAGQLVFSGSPTLSTPTLSGNTTAGTINSTTIPSSATLVKASDTISALTAAASSVWAGEITDETGSGSVVFSSSPSLTTPSLGVATATSINGTTIPSSKTLVVTTDTLAVMAATTSAQLAGVLSDESGTGAAIFATQPTVVLPTIQTGTIELGYRQVAAAVNNPNVNFAYQLSSISTNANFNATVQNASSNLTLQVIYTNTSSSWITGTLSSTFSVLGGATGVTATAIALAPTNITHVKYWTDRLTNYFLAYESGIPNLPLDSIAGGSPTAGDSLIYHATVGWTNIAGFDSYTNTWTADTPLVLGRTNYYATSGAATIGITGVGNLPTNVQRSTELTVLATGTVTFTNVAGIRTSDFVNSRTLTNGNVMVIGLTVIPGRSTNAAFAQFRAQ